MEVAPQAAEATGSLQEENSPAATPMVKAAAAAQNQECSTVAAPMEAPSITGGAPLEASNIKAKTLLYAAVSEDMVRGTPLLGEGDSSTQRGERHSTLLRRGEGHPHMLGGTLICFY